MDNKGLKNIENMAKNGGEEARYLAGISFEKEEKYREAFRWFLEAANDGHVESQIKIGDYYALGIFIKQDFQKSVLWYTRASTYGNPEALIKLANLYREGLGTEKDLKLAFDLYYRASSNSEDSEALYQLANLAKDGLGTNKDLQSAFLWYTKASDLGHVKAMINLGYCYAYANGVSQDPNKAFELFKKAHYTNNPIALFNLGVCYKEGFGTNKDLDKAIELFKKAISLDHSTSYTYLAKCYEDKGEDEQLIIDCYENAYAQGSYKACYCLSKIYENKKEQLSRIEWLLKGKNDIDCLRELGILCFEGDIAQLDYIKAFECFYKAAEQNDVISSYYLYLMYSKGLGVDVDNEKAMNYLSFAFENNYKEAIIEMCDKIDTLNSVKALSVITKLKSLDDKRAYFKLGKWYSLGYVVEKDENKAFEYYSKGAELEDAQSMCNLAICYVNGKGIKSCPELGVYWFKKASEHNSLLARYNLGYCYECGVGTNIDLQAAISSYASAARDGHGESAYRLGKMYVDKESIRDYQTAIYWLNMAVEKGNNKKAYEELAKIYGSEAYYDEDKSKYMKEMAGIELD